MLIEMRKIFLFLLFVVFFLMIMQLIPSSYSWTINDKFNFNKEGNIPTWYSSTLLFGVALSSFGISLFKKGSKDFHHYFWLIFGLCYLFLSFDEGAQVHETIDRSTPVKWVFIYAPFGGLFFLLCAYYFLFVKHGERESPFWILCGLVVYAIGGVGMETISYAYQLSPVFQFLEIILEEGMEMIGTIMVLMGCLRRLKHEWSIAQMLKLPAE